MKAEITSHSGFTFTHYMRFGLSHFIQSMKYYQNYFYHIKIIRENDNKLPFKRDAKNALSTE